jgi:hypothetical protein
VRAKTHRSSLGLGGASGKEEEGLTVGATPTETRACSTGRRKANETGDVVIGVMGYRTFVSKVIIEGNYYLHRDEAEVRGKGEMRSVLGSRTLFPLSHPTYPSRWSSES